MPTTDYTEFLNNVKQEFITNSYELDGTFIFDIEGTNNKVKVLKRISYGLRHFGRFRVRILLLSKKNDTNHKYDWCQRRLVG